MSELGWKTCKRCHKDIEVIDFKGTLKEHECKSPAELEAEIAKLQKVNMKLFVYEMEDLGEYSYERHYILAENRKQADELLKETQEDKIFDEWNPEILKRPHSVRVFEGPCVAQCEMY